MRATTDTNHAARQLLQTHATHGPFCKPQANAEQFRQSLKHIKGKYKNKQINKNRQVRDANLKFKRKASMLNFGQPKKTEGLLR